MFLSTLLTQMVVGRISRNVACSKCPFHYVITPFTFHMNRDNIILQTSQKDKRLMAAQPEHICARNMKEENLPNYIYLRLLTPYKARMQFNKTRSLCTSAPRIVGQGREGKARGLTERWNHTQCLCIPDVLKIHCTDKSFVKATFLRLKTRSMCQPTLSHNHLILSVASPFSSTNGLFIRLTHVTAIFISGLQIPSLSSDLTWLS